ncbi:FAD-binding oxidoreductase [Sphingomonas sp. DG1-23]|uniref:NAD(P)/FAD-dependent oxidoreductase n=1 Tax=Sphingomonas sp. DG1-23 TaxID=3068316 RepID=UPI00273E3863|nr:FAD-binding oxidoreductase [Sphingomonas sp. DG1-23]MDP5279007.1 FAD-binding oxidoreductase [Sphingomonas sp. DG1-23]
MRRITIIGGGVVGLCCASALLRAGNAVTVLESSASGDAASWGNAGHIATEQVAPLASMASLRSAWGRRFAVGGALDLPMHGIRAWAPFALRLLSSARPDRFRAGSDALRALLAEALPAWQRASWASELVKTDGHLVVWGEAGKATAGKAAWESADIGTAHLEEAAPQDIDRIRAVTSAPIAGALRFSGTGQISDLHQLAAALERDVARRGGQILRETGALIVEQGQARIPGHDADLVLVAAGVRSKPLVERAGHHAPIVAERGYHIRAAADDWPADLPPIVFEDRSMIVTRYADTVQAASFVELASPEAPPDPRKWERLEHHVVELGLPMRPPFTRWMGARPTLPDYLPAIGRSRRATNLLYAFGHQHLGLTLAPLTAELVAALAEDSNPNIDLTPFDLERFGGKGGRA